MQVISIEKKQNFSEYLQWYLYGYWKQLIIIFIFIVCVIVAALLLIDDFGITISFLIAFLFSVIYITNYNYTRIKKKFLPVQKEGTAKYSFTGTQITILTLTVGKIHPWSEFVKVKETRRFILLFREKDFYFIPKKSFTQEQLLQFRELVSSVPSLKIYLNRIV